MNARLILLVALLLIHCPTLFARNPSLARMFAGSELAEADAADQIAIEFVLIDTDVTAAQASVRILFRHALDAPRHARLRAAIRSDQGHIIGQYDGPTTLTTEPGQIITFTIPAANFTLWSPQTPVLYTLDLSIVDAEGLILDQRHQRFGWRSIRLTQDRIYFNDQPIYLRGTMRLPLSYSPTNFVPDYMRRLIRSHKQMNFNFIRHHTTVPPPWYYDIPDEEGIFITLEMGFDLENARELVCRLYNHPSIIFWGGTNEISHMDGNAEIRAWYDLIKSIDPSRPVYDSTGWGEFDRDTADIAWDHFGVIFPYAVRDGSNFEFFDFNGTAIFPILGRNLYDLPFQYMHPRRISARIPPEAVQASIDDGSFRITRPRMIHEVHGAAQTYTEGMLVIEHRMRSIFEAIGLDYERWPAYVRSNQQFSAANFKIALEYARAANQHNGYDWIQTEDCESVRMDLAGACDHFGNPKPFTEQAYRTANGPHLLLLNQGEQLRTLWNSDTLRATLQTSCFDFPPPEDLTLYWTLSDGDRIVRKGMLNDVHPAYPGVGDLLPLDISLDFVNRPSKLILSAELNGTDYQIANDWNIWVYPRDHHPSAPPDGIATDLPWIASLGLADSLSTIPDAGSIRVLVTDELTTENLRYVNDGGHLLVLQNHGKWLPAAKTNYRQRDYTSFWAGWSMGVAVEDHPALVHFPHDGFNDLQFYPIMQYSSILIMDYMPASLHPIMECVPVLDANRPGRSGFLWEGGVGSGSLMISGLNLRGAASDEPVSSFLLGELIRYCADDSFRPRGRCALDAMLLGLEAGRDSIWPSDQDADEIEYDLEYSKHFLPNWVQLDAWGYHSMVKAVDAYRSTYWQAAEMPAELVLDYHLPERISGLRIEFLDPLSLPAADTWSVQVPTADGQWQTIEAAREFEGELIWRIRFEPVQTPKLKLVFTQMNTRNQQAVADEATPYGFRAGYPTPGLGAVSPTPGLVIMETSLPRIREIVFLPSP